MSSTETKRFWRQQIKHRVVLSLGGKCSICKQIYSDTVYDCHHLNPEQKDISISSIQTNGAKSWYKIRDELRKCCLLCANCHRLVHSGEAIVENISYFNEEYYNWELAEYKQISKDTMLPLDIDKNKFICPKCLGKKTPTAELCMSCRNKEQQEIERPTRDELKNLIRNFPFTEIGRKFLVTDNSVRKWCDKYSLPRTKKEINQYSDEDWEKL